MMTDIDFARALKPYPAWLRWGLLALGALLLLAMVYAAKQTQAQISVQNGLLQAKQPASLAPKADPNLAEAIIAANLTQLSLQTPWLSALDQLAQVKAQHADIKLLSVAPNRNKAEIIVIGEAKHFEAITAFLEDLKKSAPFADAVLQNQRLIEPENGAPEFYQFNAQLTWRLNTQEQP